jgi:type III pantothenate kinase
MKKIIAIDIGNSETTVGVGNSSKWESYRYTTRKTITSDELFMMFNTTIDLSKTNDEIVDGAIVCSVVPQITESVVSAINKFTSKDVLVVGPGVKTGLKVNIDNPKELGPDRIANSVGGFKKINKEVVIVDLGTATTFDVVNSNKEYLGGSIAPGIKISLDALISRTSSLKSVELKEPGKVIGKNTYEAIQSGLVLGHASMIDSMLEKNHLRV